MGHHPPPTVGAEQIQGVGSGIAPATWFMVIIGVVIVWAIIYYIIKKGGNKK